MQASRNPPALLVGLFMLSVIVTCSSDSPELLGSATQFAVSASGSVTNPGNETTNTAPMGWTAGNFAVTADGAASYVIPIWVPEGLGGLKPDLSLGYDSNAATSSPGVGVGWGLSGFPLSRITRCSRTAALDGAAAPVSWTDSTYCFDGERLVAVGEASGLTSFRKERDDATRVVVQGTSLSAPTGFTVYYKAGWIGHFGSSGASRIDGNAINWAADGSSTTTVVTYAWLLDSLSDRAGQLPSGVDNTISVTYDKHSRSNTRYPSPLAFVEVVPSRIDYSYVAGAPRRSVLFGYYDGDRGDSNYSFIAGLGIASTRALTSITVQGPNPTTVATLRTYSLGYEAAPTSGRDRLHSIQECDQFNLCKPATTFGYEAGSLAFKDISATGITQLYDSPVIVDYGNDGNDDVISPDHELGGSPPGTPPFTNFYLRSTTWSMVNGVRTFDISDFIQLPSSLSSGSSSAMIELADLNGNGVLETPVFSNQSLNPLRSFWSWKGDPADPPKQLYNTVSFLGFPNQVGPMATPLYFADLDGDGAVDLTWVRSLEPPGGTHSTGRPAYSRNTFRQTLGTSNVVTYATPVDISDSGGSALTTLTGGQGVMQGFVGTFENSMRHGILTLRATTTTDPSILRSISISGSGQAVSVPVVRTLSTYPRLFLLDVNGDGLTDFIDTSEQVPGSGNNLDGSFAVNHVYLNTGQGFTPPTSGGHPMVPGAGDSATNYLFNNTTVVHQGLPNDSVSTGILVGDFNQDGIDDVVFAGVATGSSRTEMRFMRGATHPSDTTSLVPFDKLYTDTSVAIPLALRSTNGGGYSWAATGDFNGDGLIDILSRPANDSSHLHYYIHVGKKADQMISIAQGLGPTVSIAYDTIMNPNVHTPCTLSASITDSNNYTHCVRGKRWVVSGYSVDSDQGTPTGQRNPASYSLSYSGGRIEAQRGWLGFETKMVLDNQRDLVHVTHYANTDYRTAMMPDVDAYSSGTIRSRVSTSYTVTPFPPAYTVFPTSITAIDDEMAVVPSRVPPFQDLLYTSGSVVTRLSLITNSYDRYGDILTSSVARPIGNSFDTTTTSTYTYNSQDFSNNWLIGRVTAVTVKSTDVIHPEVSRQSSCDYFAGTIWPSNCTTEPTTTPPGAPTVTGADTSVTSTTTYTRDSHAQLTSEVTAATATSDDPLSGQTLTRRVDTTYDTADGVYPVTKSKGSTGSFSHTIALAYHPGLGVLAQSTDENNAVTSRTYDGFGRPTGISPPTGANTTISYETPSDSLLNTNTDGPSFAVHTTTTGGGESDEIYNYNGRLIDIRSMLSDGTFSSVLTRYTLVPGQVDTVTLPTRANTAPTEYTSFFYDPFGRVVEKDLPDGIGIYTNYSTPPGGGLQIDVQNERGRTHHTAIDQAGRTISYSNDTVSTSYSYGQFDLQTQITPPSLQSTSAGTPRSPVIKVNYDVLGRKTWIQDGDLGKRKTSYNAFGEIVAETDASGATTKYTRDGIGRPTRRDDGNGDYVVYTWDAAVLGIGLIAQSAMHEQGDTYTHTYTSYLGGGLVRGDVLNITNWPRPGVGTNYTVSYTYDKGRLSRITYPPIQSVNQNTFVSQATFYDFDAIGQVKNVKGGWCTATSTCTPTPSVTYLTEGGSTNAYEADNQVTLEDVGGGSQVFGGVTTGYGYDPHRRWIRGVNHTGNPMGGIISTSYQPDFGGNVVTRTNTSVNNNISLTEQFTYDSENMLTSWDRGGHGADFRTADTDGGGFMLSTTSSLDYTPPASLPAFSSSLQPEPSQLAHGISSSAGFGLTYDANGNETRSDWMSFSSATYTSFNLPLSITPTGAPAPITYRYDGANHRVLRKAMASGNGPDTAYLGELFEARLESDGTVTYVFYVPGPNGLVAQQTWTQATIFISPPVQQRILYFLKDKIGSITAITSSLGNLEWLSNYAPWGNTTTMADGYHNVRPYTLPGAPSPTVTRGFVGLEHEWGPTTTPLLANGQLINMRGRVYDSSLARFLSPDPLVSAPLSINGYDRYAYAFNNPLRFLDPSGFEQVDGGKGNELILARIIKSICHALGGCGAHNSKQASPAQQVGPTEVTNPTGDPGSKPPEPPPPPRTPPEPPPPPIAKMSLEQAIGHPFTNAARQIDSATARSQGFVAVGTGKTLSFAMKSMAALELPVDAVEGVSKIASGDSDEQVEGLGQVLTAGVMLVPEVAPEVAEIAEGVPRALTAADIGLSGKGLAELTGTALDAAETRILTVDMIKAAEGATVPVSEIRSAIPTILQQARSSGIKVLQIDATFGSPRLQNFVFKQVTQNGGVAASVGGRDVMTFLLGGSR